MVTGVMATLMGLPAPLTQSCPYPGPDPSISANPIWPATVGLGEPYTITVGVLVEEPHHAAIVRLYAQPDGAPWEVKGIWLLSGLAAYGQHTWTNANFVPGEYWWRGDGECEYYAFNHTGSIGLYTTN